MLSHGGFISCSGDDEGSAPTIGILSSTVNGSNFSSANQNIAISTEIVIVFSSALNPSAFESAFSISSSQGEADYSLSYSNATTKATMNMTLDFNTAYQVAIGNIAIGAKGEKLDQVFSFNFITAEDDLIRSMAPCTSVGACLRSVELEGTQGMGTFEFYSNYPLYEENAKWQNLTQAVLVVHGASHNPDDYYSYMTSTLEAESLSESTVLISPFFRKTSTGSFEDFYWASTNWRRGQQSSNSNKLSSFEVIDKLIDQLADKDHFPFLKKIIITGHSSGAAFTHVYGGSNKSEATHTSVEFEYVVANSQFLYYPDGQRINESTNQLYTPTGCAGYDFWPYGFSATPPYLMGTNSSTYNSQFVNRSITYLLGNGNQSDPTLNTTSCQNTLQGSTRYNRGENMFRYMELSYPASHNHSKTVVSGIGHNGQGMYQSSEFKALLTELLQ